MFKSVFCITFSGSLDISFIVSVENFGKSFPIAEVSPGFSFVRQSPTAALVVGCSYGSVGTLVSSSLWLRSIMQSPEEKSSLTFGSCFTDLGSCGQMLFFLPVRCFRRLRIRLEWL